MVGIVVVSHSRPLALAAVALAQEMVAGRPVRIEVAAGLDDDTFGTDAVQIMAAVAAADDGDGVVVLMDLGSAVLSAELALDLLDDDARDRVLLCAAPLVEGLVVAAVSATGGAGRAEVAAEATAALAGKQTQLGVPAAPAGTAATPDTAAGALTAVFTVTNPHGLHARPAARLVQEVRGLAATVLLRNLSTGGPAVPAASLSQVATLGVLAGHEVEVTATGEGAAAALEQVLALARRGFDEPGGEPAGTVAAPADERAAGAPADERAAGAPGGLPASPGIAVGPVHRLAAAAIEVPDARTDDPAADHRRLHGALAAVRAEVGRVRERTAAQVGETDARIFDAHLMLLEDPVLLDDVRARVDAGQAVAPAWAAAVAGAQAALAALPDAYLRARAADVRAVGDQVLHALLGTAPAPAAAGRGVLVAADLTPAQAADLDPALVEAVVLAYGSPTAHSAILARAKGIPAVVAAGPGVLDLPDGTVLAVDGGTGELVAAPDPVQEKEFRDRAAALEGRRAAALTHAAAPAATTDGTRVLVAANLGSPADAAAAAAAGADGAGLVRTEFLFLDRSAAPSVDEQEQVYLSLAQALGGRRLTLRTLDVGGDKPLGYVPVPAEANPFLGLRGLRLSLARPGLLADQLAAVVRVAHVTPVSLMFPMVSALDELFAARRLLDEAVAAAGRGTPAGLEVGIMVEVPAAALKAAAFAPHVDFFSVGTNDLTQYALAAERGNDAVAAVGDPLDPGVLALVAAVCRGAGGALVAVCGELAADERAAALLVGLGVRELSVAPRAVPDVKQAVRAVDLPAAAALAARALAAPGPAAVREMLGAWSPTST